MPIDKTDAAINQLIIDAAVDALPDHLTLQDCRYGLVDIWFGEPGQKVIIQGVMVDRYYQSWKLWLDDEDRAITRAILNYCWENSRRHRKQLVNFTFSLSIDFELEQMNFHMKANELNNLPRLQSV